jgi:hypothetical protein
MTSKYVFSVPRERVYFLAEDSKTLLGGARFVSAIALPGLGGGAATVHGGATVLPAQPRVGGREEIIVGLNTVTEEPSKKHYYVVNSMGEAIPRNDPLTYAAQSPSAAAVKAFYAWWRTSKQGDKCVDRSLVSLTMSGVPALLVEHLSTLDSTKVTQEQKKEYVKQFLCINTEKISREIIIRIGSAKKQGSVSFYRVSYKPNLRPNALEIANKMVVMASAIRVLQNEVLPANAVEFETVL